MINLYVRLVCALACACVLLRVRVRSYVRLVCACVLRVFLCVLLCVLLCVRLVCACALLSACKQSKSVVCNMQSADIMCTHMIMHFAYYRYVHMGWLRLVGSLKSQVSFEKETYKRDNTLQKRPIISRSLLIVGTS